LSDSDVLSSYKIGKKGSYIIPFDRDEAEVLPGGEFNIEIHLAKKWKREDINLLIGKWGYLHIDLVYQDELVEEFEAI
jgi:hypothetical protein